MDTAASEFWNKELSRYDLDFKSPKGDPSDKNRYVRQLVDYHSIFAIKSFVCCKPLVSGTVYKRRPQSGGFVQCGQGGGFFRYGRPHFLEQKTSEFSKFLVCPHGQEGGWASADILRARGEGWGVNFSRFCTGRLLWTAPYSNCTFSYCLCLCHQFKLLP